MKIKYRQISLLHKNPDSCVYVHLPWLDSQSSLQCWLTYGILQSGRSSKHHWGSVLCLSRFSLLLMLLQKHAVSIRTSSRMSIVNLAVPCSAIKEDHESKFWYTYIYKFHWIRDYSFILAYQAVVIFKMKYRLILYTMLPNKIESTWLYHKGIKRDGKCFVNINV